MNNLIPILVKERLRQGKTQEVLADELGYTSRSLGSWERGDADPYFLGFVDWAEGLGYEVVLRKVGGGDE